MDRALILVMIAAVERERLLIRLREREQMVSAIHDKMAKLRAARQNMIDDLSSEIDAVTTQVVKARDDGLEAMKLPRAEIDATKQLIADIRAEFAPQTNGGPAGPLPGSAAGSLAPSVNSAGPAAAEGQAAEKKT